MKTRKSILIILAIAFISVSLANPHNNRRDYIDIEYPVTVEEWMTKPFSTTIYEEPLEIEEWMTKPFKIN